jgi:hypothetical protein
MPPDCIASCRFRRNDSFQLSAADGAKFIQHSGVIRVKDGDHQAA